jgi:hypothetical protein
MREFLISFLQAFSTTPCFSYLLTCLVLGLFLILLGGFSYFESRSLTPSALFSIALLCVGFFLTSVSIEFGRSFAYVFLGGGQLCLYLGMRAASSKKIRRSLCLALLLTLPLFMHGFLFGKLLGLVVNAILVLCLIFLTFKIQENQALSLLKIFCFAPCVWVLFFIPLSMLAPTGDPFLILSITTLETTFLFLAYWFRAYGIEQFRVRFQSRENKSIFPQGNPTQFNPFVDEQDFLRSATIKLSGFKELCMLSAGMISKDEKSITFYQWNSNGEKELAKKIPLPPQILESLFSLSKPLQRFQIEFSTFSSEFSDFLRQCAVWDSWDFLLPIHHEKKTAVLMFFSSIFPQHATHRIAPLIFDIHASFECLFLISETLQKERELQPLLLETRERKISYETLASKINDIHETLSDLQSRQSDLIQSERWISISQITVTLNHEINNPLTHVLGTAQLLKMKLLKKTLTDAQFQRSFNTIFEEALRIVEIVKSLRRLSVFVIEKYLPEIDMIKLDLPPQSRDSAGKQ